MAKLYTSPFGVPSNGGFCIRNNSGAVQSLPEKKSDNNKLHQLQ